MPGDNRVAVVSSSTRKLTRSRHVANTNEAPKRAAPEGIVDATIDSSELI
jgi:hypothetical protein